MEFGDIVNLNICIVSYVTWVTYVTCLSVFSLLKFRGNLYLIESVWYGAWYIISLDTQ